MLAFWPLTLARGRRFRDRLMEEINKSANHYFFISTFASPLLSIRGDSGPEDKGEPQQPLEYFMKTITDNLLL